MSMRRSAWSLALAVLAAMLTAGTASANTITADPAGGITATSLGRLSFSSAEFSIMCSATIRGAINRTINNAASGSVGSFTEGRAIECSMGRATLLFEARSAWPLTLAEATRLEAATKKATVNIGNAKLQFAEIFGLTCLYEGSIGTTLEGEGEGERFFTRLVRVNANRLSRVSGSFLCPASGELRGEFSLTAQRLALKARSMRGELNPTNFNGNVNEEHPIRWENTGAKIVNGDRIRVESSRPEELRVIEDPCSGTEINEGGFCTVRVKLVNNPMHNQRLDVRDKDGNIIGEVTLVP